MLASPTVPRRRRTAATTSPRSARAEFPWTDETIYLNHASIGPLPERTRLALEAFNRRRATPFRLPDRDLFGTLTESRRLVAELLIGARRRRSRSPSTPASGSASWPARSRSEPGDVVLVSDREFPANVYPWIRLRETGHRRRAGADHGRRAGRTRRGCSSGSRIRGCACWPSRWCSSATATRWISPRSPPRPARTGAWLVVDAIQGVGQVPVDLRATPVDVLACGGQKWLLSPWGSGFVYVRRELIAAARARRSPGWMAFEGTDDFTRLTSYNDTLRADARRFELITLPYQDFAGMNASLGLLLELGVERIAGAPAAAAPAGAGLGRADGRAGGLAARDARLGHPVPRARRRRRGLPPAQGGAHHLQPARGGHPAEPARVQHRRGDGAGGGGARGTDV